MRLWLVTRTRASWCFATYSVLVDRAIGLIALAIVVVVSLPLSFELIRNDHGRAALVLVDVAAMSAAPGFLVVGRLRWRWLETWWPTRHVHACSVIANQVIFNRTTGPRIAALSVFIYVLKDSENSRYAAGGSIELGGGALTRWSACCLTAQSPIAASGCPWRD